MGLEIERKFLVRNDDWHTEADAGRRLEQAYLCGDGPASVRVRVDGEAANLNIKAAVVGAARAEYEYAIDLDEAREMMATIAMGEPIRKTRYHVSRGPHVWEIDVFEGANAPLVVAEIELGAEQETFDRPAWLGDEVTEDRRYYNHALAFAPYGRWPSP